MTVGSQPDRLTGFEHGLLSTAGGALFGAVSNASVVSTTVRSGTYALRINPTAGVGYANWSTTPSAVMHGRVYFRFATLPDVNTVIFDAESTVGSPVVEAGIQYNAATGKLRAFASDDGQVPVRVFDADGPTVTTGIWYRLDYSFNTNDPITVKWQIDGSAQTDFVASAGYGGNTMRQIACGDIFLATYTADMFFDDLICWTNNGGVGNLPLYPVGAGRIILLKPNGAGTHVNDTSFTDNSGNSPPTTIAARLDEVPVVAALSDWVKQTTASATDYLELTIEDLPADATGFNGAMVFIGSDADSALDENVRFRVFGSGVNAANALMVNSGDFVFSKDGLGGIAGWDDPTVSDINGCVFRIGFGSDVSPNRPMECLWLEVDYDAPDAAGVGWYWGAGTGWHDDDF